MEKAPPPVDESAIAIDSLYPALFKCFGVILCGYIAGRLNVIEAKDTKGIATFVGHFSLPCLIFLSLARMDFSKVYWMIILGILLAKSIVFASVLIITMLLLRPMNLGKAGLYAIFCTQSNDFAVGYPIFSVLYLNTHPEYASYLYLLAPISLVILNPIGFVFMEINKEKEQSAAAAAQNETKASSKMKLVKQIVKNIAYNPIIFMTVCGIIANIAFKNIVASPYITGILHVFGEAFASTALFLLGLRMVGQVHKLKGTALVLPCLFIMAKLLILPVIMRECVKVLNDGANTAESLSLSNYAFLYGTLPTAVAVFVYSNMYQLEIELVAASMVICTFMSGPIMFVTARMIFITDDFQPELKKFAFNLSIVALIVALWVLLVFFVTKKFKLMPHRLTLCLIVSQVLLAISVIMGGPDPDKSSTIQPALKLFSLYSCLLWTTMLCVGILMMQRRGTNFAVKLVPVLALVAWGLPAVMVAILVATKGDGALKGKTSDAIRLCLLVCCLLVSSGCMIMYVGHSWRSAQFASLAIDQSTAPDPSGLQPAAGRRGSEHQLFRHTLYIIEASLSMFIGITYTTWTSLEHDKSGVFAEIAYLDIVATYGQAVVLFAVFGTDLKDIVIPTIGYFKKKL